MQPFLTGRNATDSPSLQPARVPAEVWSGGQVRACASGGPSVETVKEGDKIVRIIVTCACGERTEVECLYPAGS